MPTLTIRIDNELDASLKRLAKEQRRSKSEVARQLLRRHLALAAFDKTRRELLPLGERAGIVTDEDVFNLLS